MKAVANYGFAYKNVLYKAGDELDVTVEDLKHIRNDVTLLEVEEAEVVDPETGDEKEIKEESNKMLKKSNKVKTK